MTRWLPFFALAVLLALALRLPELGNRPMHNDEGVNAVKFGQLWDHGEYRYDPTEHHGPTLHYFTAAFCKLTGAPDYKHLSEARLRLLTALAGVVIILLLPILRDDLGRGAIAAAAFLTALSPAMVFYSRYWIHEELLVLFSFLAIGAVWRFVKQPSWGWAALSGAALALMQATKETFVFVLAAAIGSIVLDLLATGLTRRLKGENGLSTFALPERRDAMLKHVAVGIVVWLVVWATLFSSFFTNWTGLLDSIRTYIAWSDNAGHQSPHSHEWDFYLERLFWFKSAQGMFWTEGLLFILAIFAVRESFRLKPRMAADATLVRFLAFYTVLLAAIYAVIPYKTPWCALGFLHGLILLAGVGASVLWRINSSLLPRIGLAFVLGVGAMHLGLQAYRASFVLPADRANPWVYAQTSPDLLNLVEKVRNVAQAGQGDATLIKVITAGGDCWPLPWYLRQFDNVGYWQEVTGDPLAPIVIASAKSDLKLDAQGTHVMVGYFALRPQVFLELYVERTLWENFLKKEKDAPHADLTH